MEDLLVDIDRAIAAGLHFIALTAALTVPDICAAASQPSGRTDGPLYKAWVEQNMTDDERQGLSPADCYRFRCSLLHQGNAYHDESTDRIVFVEPGGPLKVSGGRATHGEDGPSAQLIDMQDFCEAIVHAARRWAADSAADPVVQKNVERLIRRHPQGIPPFGSGIRMIG
jgi:hypothetical protein